MSKSKEPRTPPPHKMSHDIKGSVSDVTRILQEHYTNFPKEIRKMKDKSIINNNGKI
ncbi:MAG: hypothetical protein ACXAAH_01560 [Promethearchaeota archaeon]|jgi:hypothetical protein